MHKQVYDLRTGRLPGPARTWRCATYPVRCRDGMVEVAGRPTPVTSPWSELEPRRRVRWPGSRSAVTADRRRDELAALLERRGARVVLAPALRIVPLADDADLRAATAALPRHAARRSWSPTPASACAAGWRRPRAGASPSRCGRRSARAYLIARGPKARGAMRAAGLVDQWSPDSESCEEVLTHLLRARRRRRADRGAAARRAISRSSAPRCRPPAPRSSRCPVYRWAPPTDPAPLHRLVDLIAGRQVDAVTFTSAPAVDALLRAAGPDRGRACSTRCAPTCWPPASARSPPRRCATPGCAGGRARPGPPGRAGPRPRSTSCPGARAPLHVAGRDGDPARPRRRGRRRRCARCRRRRWRCCGRWPTRAGPGAAARDAAARAAPGRATSTRWRWRSPGCGPRSAAPDVRADRGQARLPPPHRHLTEPRAASSP